MEELAKAMKSHLDLVGQVRQRIQELERENFDLRSQIERQQREIRDLKNQLIKN